MAAREPRTPANITVSWLAVTIVVGVWRIVTAARGADDDLPTLVAAFVFALTGLAFLQWRYRARRGLDRLGATGLTWRPGWAIGGWFIPIANLVIPLLVVNEIDRAGPRRPGRWVFAAWAVVTGTGRRWSSLSSRRAVADRRYDRTSRRTQSLSTRFSSAGPRPADDNASQAARPGQPAREVGQFPSPPARRGYTPAEVSRQPGAAACPVTVAFGLGLRRSRSASHLGSDAAR
jgi:hypothetical protein